MGARLASQETVDKFLHGIIIVNFSALAVVVVLRQNYIARIAKVFADNGQTVRGDLKAVLCDFELDEPTIYAVWAPNRALSAKVRAFVDFLGERFGGTPYWDRGLPP